MHLQLGLVLKPCAEFAFGRGPGAGPGHGDRGSSRGASGAFRRGEDVGEGFADRDDVQRLPGRVLPYASCVTWRLVMVAVPPVA